MTTKDQSTAKNKAKSFGECIADSGNLAGCTSECAPTYGMLIQSENPVENAFSKNNFGAVSGNQIDNPRPSSSICVAEDEV